MSSLDVRPENRPKGVVAFPFRKFTGAKVNKVCAFMRFQSFLMRVVDDQITMLAKFQWLFSNLFFNFLYHEFSISFKIYFIIHARSKELESFGFMIISFFD